MGSRSTDRNEFRGPLCLQFLRPFLGSEWVAAAVAVVVVVGVCAYVSLNSRISTADEQIQSLEIRSKQLQDETDVLRNFSQKAQQDINELADRHN